MCGIVGIYNLKAKDQKPETRKIIQKMADALTHRGPDDEGVFIGGKIAMGHRRLSILDLSAAGCQPMFSRDKRFAIVFNGEIYNYLEIKEELKAKGYRFKTTTDTEVILSAYEEWGEACLERFNGMWGLAIYDRKNDTLFAARDRLGVKPFYYYLTAKEFVFASEIKAILAYPNVPRKPNDQIIYDFLVHGFTDHTNNTFFKGIKQLSPGHSLKITGGKVKISRYWDIDPKNKLKLTEKEAIQKFRELFEDSIRLRLRADVPVGTCLSGGLDSSAIVVGLNDLLKKTDGIPIKSIGEKQKTFSSVYSSREFQKANEKPFMNEVVKKTKVKSYFAEPNAKNLFRDLKKMIWHQDGPFASTSIYAQWNVFQLASKNSVKVILDGQGADEEMAGYLPLFGIFLAEEFRRGHWLNFFREIRAFVKKHPNTNFKALTRSALFYLAQVWFGKFFDPIFKRTRQSSLEQLAPEFVEKNFHVLKPQRVFNNFLKDYNYWMVKYVSLPGLLHWEDRNSMASSIESRVPFLDYRLVEFIFSLPNNLIIKNGTTKYILREAMKDLLPAKIYNRHDKVGFATPEEIWFKKYIRKDVEKILDSRSFRSRPYFNHEKVKKYFDDVMSGRRTFDFTIWRWISLEMWMREFIDK